MGKIADALEKRKREKKIQTEELPSLKPKELVDEKTIQSPAQEIVVQEKTDSKLLVHSEPNSVDAENFKLLRAQILFPKEGDRPRTIMVTSAFPGEGKTFVASNLAMSIALGINEYVFLVDCDFRRPDLHKMFGYSNIQGLHEFLIRKRELPELIIRTKFNKLSLLAAGKTPPNPSELLSSSRMRDFLVEVRGRYQDRYVIIDAAPSQVTAEANVLAKYVDGIILVIMMGKSPKKVIRKSIENLGHEKILGIVFNGYDHSYRGYRKYYRNYYRKDR